jgi:hypothetical protein
MKSIKPFKLFESSEDLKHIVIECEDILLELKDEGFKTDISKGTSPHDWILVNISKKDTLPLMEDLMLKDIEETVERLKNYLSNLGFKTYNSASNYPNVIYQGVTNPYDFSTEYILSKTSIQFNKTNLPHFARNIDSYIKTTESKKEVYKSIVSDIKYDLQDILIELVDENFKYQININDWNKNYKLINDNEVVKWVSLEISKEGDWNLTEVEDYLIRVVEFLSLKGLYPLFDPKPQSKIETILISNHSDIFKNRMHKVAGTTNTFAYDIQFKTDDVS